MKELAVVLGLAIAAFALIFWALSHMLENQAVEYRAACTELRGKPIHDGRQWTCLGVNASSL